MKLTLSLISMVSILSVLVPGPVLGQGDFRIFVTDYDAIHELDLKATEGQNGQVNQASGFAIEANAVVQIHQNENLQVFTSTNEPERIEKVKVTDQSGQLIELTKSGNEWSLQGFDDGVYLLDVIANMPNGERGAFETMLVILAPNTQKADPNQVIKQVVKTDTKVVFRDQKPKPKPSICYFDPDNKACNQLPGGGCPKGFGFNDDDRCIPTGPCPSGYGRLDNDETGKCYPDRDIKTCPDGYVTHKSYKCPTLVPEPIVCPAGQELSSDGFSCAPPCDGSYQDCIYNGYLCRAGSTEHACELPLTEEKPAVANDCILVPTAPGCGQTLVQNDPFTVPNLAQGEEPSCQPEDDFCEPGCESSSMDCIDDVNIGDNGEDLVPEEEEEEEEPAAEEDNDNENDESFEDADNADEDAGAEGEAEFG
jgi:hypothetical protein